MTRDASSPARRADHVNDSTILLLTAWLGVAAVGAGVVCHAIWSCWLESWETIEIMDEGELARIAAAEGHLLRVQRQATEERVHRSLEL